MALSRLANASALGLNSLVMQFYGLVVSISISGLSIALSTLAARQRHDEMRSLLSSGLRTFAALWFCAAFPFILFSKGIAEKALGDPGVAPTLVLMLLCIFLTGIENVLKSIHLGTGNVVRCAASELTEQGVRFALVILLLNKIECGSDGKTVFLIMLGMVFSEFVSVSFLSVSFIKLFPKEEKRFKRSMMRPIAAVAFPASLTSVSSNLISSAGSLLLPARLISYGLTRSEALSGIGIISTSAVPLTMLPMAFMGAVAAVIMPELSSMLAEGKDTYELIKKAFVWAAAASALSSFVIFIRGRDTSMLLFGTAPSDTVFFLIELRAVFIYIQVVSTAVLNGQMRQREVLAFAISGDVFGLILMLLLVPVFGFPGYCAAMAAGELLRLAMNLIAIAESKNLGMVMRRAI